jgi:cell wall-associated NlpC family hydrolase
MRIRAFVLLGLALFVLLLSGCATLRARREHAQRIQTVLDTAVELLGRTRFDVGGKPWRADCSGFVRACYAAAGLRLPEGTGAERSDSEALFRGLREEAKLVRGKTPRPGDLAFFHNTYDRNGNGLRDDRFSHVALVERVDADGTVQFVHFGSGTVRRDVMNLRHAALLKDPETGKVWNAWLRRDGRGRRLAGELFFRFGRPLPGPG